MADLFLSPLIKLVIDKAANPLIQQFCQMWGMEENCDKLHRYLLAVQEKIANAEEHAPDGSAQQAWMKELHGAAYEAVDVLDEFQYEARRQEAIRQQPSSSAKVLKSFFSHENALLFRQKISNKMTNILKKIFQIVQEMETFKLVQRDLAPTIDRETQSFIIESEIIGRDDETEKVVNVVLDPQREKDKVSVLPIVGMGGLGKTTLVQLVFERAKGHFQLSLWVCVSTKFSIIDIMRSIIQVAEKGTDVSISNKEVLQQKLREILERKKYLLVLDDVWNEEGEKWDELKRLLFSGAGAGSVILVTTRIKAAAEIMGTFGYCIDLAFLTEKDSWALFEMRAFGAGLRDQSKEQIGRTIARKCGGLPLAMKAMGGLMRTMSDVRQWTAVAQNEIWKVLEASSKKDILPILKLSYDYLPPHTKQCFAFCAVFPQDYRIDVDELIQLWMANDLIPTDSIMDLERKGLEIFEELRSRSFFQNLTEEVLRYDDQQIVITCSMHDLMHDLATRVAGKKCFTQLEANSPRITQKEVQNLFVSRDQSLEIKINAQFPNVRTLLVNGQNKKYTYLSKSSSLRAMQLRLSRLVSLPKELGYMRHLRYLNLSNSYDLHTLPESITKLYNLQTLNLSYTNIRELPEGMRYMTNLRHLILINCFLLQRMPAGLGQLKFLQTLTKYIVDPDRGVGIGELNNLNLCGSLSISGLEKVRDGVDAGAINLASKSGLSSLELHWSSLKETRENDEAVLEALRPYNNLKFLEIESYGGTCFSEWMKEHSIMKNLKELRLYECTNCVKLPPVWEWPLLEELELRNMESLIFIVSGTCRNADGREVLVEFSRLNILNMENLPNLEGWHERDCELVQFSNLEKLEIYNCPKLKTIPTHAPLLAELRIANSGDTKLRQISNLPMLSFLAIEVHTPPDEVNTFRPPKTLRTMDIRGFENVNPIEEEEGEEEQNWEANSLRELIIHNSQCFFSWERTRLALGFWKHFAALESLEIFYCNGLVYWPEEEFRNLRCLKKLMIYNCASFIGSLAASSSPMPRGGDSLPQLESLSIRGCSELVQLPGGSMPLELLQILTCPKLSWEGLARFTNLTELKRLDLDGFPNWRALPDNMWHLPSLEKLWIEDCPGIESLPESLQQRLPSLQRLSINNCPELVKHFWRGGDYWHLASAIPDKYISPEEEDKEITRSGTIFRRLLLKCRRS